MIFQDFVTLNKGRLFTFFTKIDGNNTLLSKIVVDVFDNYFTTKDYIDGKVNGFYYFDACMAVVHPLLTTVKEHPVCVLISQPFSGEGTRVSYFKEVNGRKDIVATSLTGGTLVYCYPYIGVKEAWALVNNEFTKVYLGESEEKKEENDVLYEGTLKKLSPKGLLKVWTDKYFKIKKDFIEYFVNKGDDKSQGIIPIKLIKKICVSQDKFDLILYEEDTAVSKEFNVSLKGRTDKEVKDIVDCILKCNSKIVFINEAVLTQEDKYNNIKRYIIELIQFVEYMSANGFIYQARDRWLRVLKCIHNSSFNKELYDEFINNWDMVKNRIRFTTESYNQDPKMQVIVRRFSELYNLICPGKYPEIVENTVNSMTPEGVEEYKKFLSLKTTIEGFTEDNYVNITYRGKPKSVMVLSSYIHNNGNKYMIVRDKEDGKRKTMFEGYISYL